MTKVEENVVMGRFSRVAARLFRRTLEKQPHSSAICDPVDLTTIAGSYMDMRVSKRKFVARRPVDMLLAYLEGVDVAVLPAAAPSGGGAKMPWAAWALEEGDAGCVWHGADSDADSEAAPAPRKRGHAHEAPRRSRGPRRHSYIDDAAEVSGGCSSDESDYEDSESSASEPASSPPSRRRRRVAVSESDE
jgi:hypothetical protein